MNWSRTLQIAVTIVLLLAVGTFVIQAFPGLVGADYALTVQSGSMEPAIKTGAIVFVEQASIEQVREGDIITYQDNGNNLITHRVVEAHRAGSSMRLVTKGDANENPDPEPVYRGEVVGKAQFSIPLIGYAVAFGQTRLGWLLMVLVPTMLLIFNEMWSLWKAGTMETEENET